VTRDERTSRPPTNATFTAMGVCFGPYSFRDTPPGSPPTPSGSGGLEDGVGARRPQKRIAASSRPIDPFRGQGSVRAGPDHDRVSALTLLLPRTGRSDGSTRRSSLRASSPTPSSRSSQSRKESAAIRRSTGKEYGPKQTPMAVNVAFVAAGLVLLVLGHAWLVNGAVAFAQAFGVSELVIGLTIVAAGTTRFPRWPTLDPAAIRGERDIAVGNVVGSNIFNIPRRSRAVGARGPGRPPGVGRTRDLRHPGDDRGGGRVPPHLRERRDDHALEGVLSCSSTSPTPRTSSLAA